MMGAPRAKLHPEEFVFDLEQRDGRSDEVLTSRVCPHSAASDIRLTLWFDEVSDA